MTSEKPTRPNRLSKDRRASGARSSAAFLALLLLPLAALAPGVAAVPTTLYSEAFDTGSASGWSLGGLWHVTSCQSFTPSYSLGYNQAGCPTNFNVGTTSGWAWSPSIAVPADALTATLTWDSWHETEAGTSFDQKIVTVYSSSSGSYTDVWIEDGAQLSWGSRTADLSAFIGDTIYVIFQFNSGDGVANNGQGWYVDDVAVTADSTTLPAVPDVRTWDDGTGNCIIYDDADHDGFPDAGEELATVPCAPDLQTRGNPDGTVTVYNDVNHDRDADAGEELATTPRDPRLATRTNNDGSCTAYDDANGNGQVDDGEALANYPCPDIKLRDNGHGSSTVYDDRDHDSQVDPGEEIATTPETEETNGLQERELLEIEDLVLTPSQVLPPDDVPGQPTPDYPGTPGEPTPDYPGTPAQPTPDYPGTPGQVTPPVGDHVGDVSVRDAGADLCVDFVPDSSAPIEIVCLNRALMGPAGPLVPRGTVGLLVVDAPDVPATQPVAVPDVPATQPQAVPDVPSTSPVAVPDVPGVPEGSLGTSPETSITVKVHYNYDPAHVTRLVGVGGGIAELYSPVGPDASELDWLAANVGNVGLQFEVTLYRDGVAQGTVTHSVPVIGQALAAAEATAGTLDL